MKKFIAFVALLLVTSMVTTSLYAQSRSEKKQEKKTERADRKSARDAERRRQKAAEAAEEGKSFQLAAQAIKAKQFVLEADQLVFRNGQNTFVNATTNFVLVDLDKGTVQVAANGAISGPNGIGGVTVDGMLSGYEISTTKKGDVKCNFSIQGVGISAQVYITMPNGNKKASVDISPNFNSQTLTLNGSIVPLEQSTIYKGTSL